MAPIFCGAPSHRCDGGNRDSRKVDREHASLSNEIARIDFSVVLFDAPAAKGETQTEPVRSTPRCSNGRNSSLRSLLARPRHSS